MSFWMEVLEDLYLEISDFPSSQGPLVPIALSWKLVLEGLWIVSGSLILSDKPPSQRSGTADKSFSSPCVSLQRWYTSQIWEFRLKWCGVCSSYLSSKVDCCLIQSHIPDCTKVAPFHISSAASHLALIDVVLYRLLHSCRLSLSVLSFRQLSQWL